MPALNSLTKNALHALVLAVLIVFTVACGYRGPLYLPEEAPEPTQRGETGSATEEPSDDTEDEEDS